MVLLVEGKPGMVADHMVADWDSAAAVAALDTLPEGRPAAGEGMLDFESDSLALEGISVL